MGMTGEELSPGEGVFSVFEEDAGTAFGVSFGESIKRANGAIKRPASPDPR